MARYIEEDENLLDLYPDLMSGMEWLDAKDALIEYLRQRVAELESTLQTIAQEERAKEAENASTGEERDQPDTRSNPDA